MPSPFRSFFYVFMLMVLFGFLVGMLNIHNPEAVYIPFGVDENGVAQSAEGLDGLITATLSAGVLGLVFGALAAIFAWGFGAAVGSKKRAETSE